MKISKVNHTRTGVLSEENRNYNGLVYKDPPKAGVNEIMKGAATDDKALERMEKYITGLNRTARVLYSVFNPYVEQQKTKSADGNSEKKKIKDADRDLYYAFFPIFRSFVSEIRNGSAEWAGLSLLDSEKVNLQVTETDIRHFVSCYLRKSLRRTVQKDGRRYDLPEIITKIICLKTGIPCENKVSNNEAEVLAGYIEKDINKKDQIRKMAASIVKQDVKIQTYSTKEGKTLLRHTIASNKKKEYIFRFLQKYTSAEQNEHENLLREIRALIVLFYCGPAAYDSARDNGVGVWRFGNVVHDGNVVFCEEACLKIQELEQTCKRINDSESKNKKTRIKKEEDIAKEQVRCSIREDIAGHYRKGAEVLKAEVDAEDRICWLNFIENCAERILLEKRRMMDPGTQDCGFLCKKTMQMVISYIAMKFVDLGKAVYHFSMPSRIDVTNGEPVGFGEVQPAYRNGITSFDYERIKAEESLTRELATYSLFAVRNFLNTISKNEDDILSLNIGESSMKQIKPDAALRALRYFGGKSKWQDTYIAEVSDSELINAFRKEVAASRNSTFHYAGTIDNGITDDDKLIISQIYEIEHDDIGRIRRKKYYSNNALMFYKKADIDALMDYLYAFPKEHPAQIPAFGKILNKNKVYEFSKFLKGNPKKKIATAGKTEELKGCIFYMLKECYYYGFLPDARATQFVNEALDEIVENAEAVGAATKDKRKEAAQNFKKRFDEISPNATLGQICQRIMTDYAMQNGGKKEIRPSKYAKAGAGEPIYQHFRMMLYDVLKKAFWKYLNALTESGEMNFMFMREPSYKAEFAAEDEFCGNWKDHSYDDIRDGMNENPFLEAWFTTAHFIAPAQLNHLIGSFKKFEQYADDIKIRAEGNGVDCTGRWETGIRYEEINSLLRVLEFVQMSNGSFTKEIVDYFGSDEESAIENYAAFIENFVEFSTKKMPSKHVALHTFCDTAIKKGSPNGKIGIYYDGENPVLNRNALMADMFGNIRLISACIKKVTEKEIRTFYDERAALEDVFKKGVCQNTEEQRALKKFQNNKNRIELLDIAIYTEIVNKLYAQLVSWAYLRERDLMYFQLGYHYMKLFYGNTVPKDSYLRVIRGKNTEITEGAVLYQLTAMNSYGWPLLDQNGEADEKATTTSNKVKSFWVVYCGGDASVYNGGLVLFERLNDHDDIIKMIRNPIDHMHYFDKVSGKKKDRPAPKSILEMYSDIYDRFFDYDQKLKKSVSFMIKNILLDYFIIVHTEMNKSEERDASGKSINRTSLEIRADHEEKKEKYDYKTRKTVPVTIRRYGMESDILTYNIVEAGIKKSVPVEARSRLFLDQMRRILEYSKV